jgi:hypothetical protein
VAQFLETPTPVPGRTPTTSDWERDAKAWNVPRQTPVASAADSVSRGTRDEELDWKGFVATCFPGTRRHNFKAIIAYSDYRRSFRVSGRSASEQTLNHPR